MQRSEKILAFWFGAQEGLDREATRKRWFSKNPAFDAQIRDRFLADHEAAAAGVLARWAESARGALALIITLDQFPRNLFRDTPRAFATDAKALQVAQDAVRRELDRELPATERLFVYLPFEHSEDLAAQERSVELITQLEGEPDMASVIDYARRHRAVIARFGRFPHRNRILGRASTAEELAFLREPGSAF
jgi:uncharacterized protein (DUF924 family)